MELTPDDIRALREWKSWLRTNGQRATRLDYSTPLPPRLLQKHTDETINVYNNTGQTIPKYGVLELDGTVYNEAELDLPPDVKSAVYNAIAPVTPPPASNSVPLWNKRICILQQELEDGEQGKAKINGITPVKVYSETNQNPFQAHVCKDEPTNRLRAEWVNSGYGFPILWRERGVGEKWALVDLKWFDAPGFFWKAPCISGRVSFPVAQVQQTVGIYPSYILTGSGGTARLWNPPASAGSRLNTAAGIIEDSTGLRVQGRGTWLGLFTAKVGYSFRPSFKTSNQGWYIEQGWLGNACAGFPQVGQLNCKVIGDNVLSHEFSYRPIARKIPSTYIGFTDEYFLSEVVDVSIPFLFVPSNTDAANVVSPIRIQVSLIAHRTEIEGYAANLVPSSYNPIQHIDICESRISMHEVNPWLFSNGWNLTGGGFVGGVSPGASPAYEFPSAADPNSGYEYPLSTTAMARITETLSSPFGGIIATPEP